METKSINIPVYYVDLDFGLVIDEAEIGRYNSKVIDDYFVPLVEMKEYVALLEKYNKLLEDKDEQR